jgi:hypothetical protein
MNDDVVAGGWVTLVPGRGRQPGRIVKMAGPPAADERITWAQRPQYRGKLVRVKVLEGEAGITLNENFQRGFVIDAPEELAKPRLENGKWRLAPDERLTFASE